MQQLKTLDDLKNTGEWYVYHNQNTHLYEIKSAAHGAVLSGSYTHRSIAERKLVQYLEEQAEVSRQRATKRKRTMPEPGELRTLELQPEDKTLEDIARK